MSSVIGSRVRHDRPVAVRLLEDGRVPAADEDDRAGGLLVGDRLIDDGIDGLQADRVEAGRAGIACRLGLRRRHTAGEHDERSKQGGAERPVTHMA